MDVSMSGVDIDAEFDMDQSTAIHDLGKRLRDEDEMSRTSSPSRTDSVHGSAKKPRRKIVIPPSTRARRNASPPPSSSQAGTPAFNGNGTTSSAGAQGYLANPGQGVGGQGFAAIQPSAALGIFDPPQDTSLPSGLRLGSDDDAVGEDDDGAFEIPPLPVAEETSSLRNEGRPPSPVSTGPTIMININRRGPNRNAQVQRQPVQKTTAKKGKAKVNDGEIPNQDFCSSCRGIGRFLCCDGCPRSFHFMCLDPPLRVDELPSEDVWYCKLCRAERDTSAKKPPTSLFAELCAKVDAENPVQFRLPPEIRNFFTGVTTAQNGAYHDSEEARTKTDRRGFIEERDPARLKDGRSRAVACYACGGSAMPGRKPVSEPGATWRPIVSCDYCSLHWHLDCLQPALTGMPPAGKKWMCPNHVEQVMPKRRTVKHNLQFLDINGQGEHNNGNIVVIPDDDAPSSKLDVDEVVINSRKYRVPEKTIRLDFWSKLGFGGRTKNGVIRAPAKATGSESPLTQLEDSPEPEASQSTMDDLSAANLVLSFYNSIADKLPPATDQDSLMTPASAEPQ